MGAPDVVMVTDLPGAISRRQGKVRDIYEFLGGLLVVATDRISAFDVNMAQGIPHKGRILTGISRYWDAATYAPGRSQDSFDKQYLRDWLDSTGWNHEPPPPNLPEEVIAGVRARYEECNRRITGQELAV